MRAQFRKARKMFKQYRQEILWAKRRKANKNLNNALVPPGYDPSGLSRKSEPDILDIAREADEPKAEDVAALWQKLANAAPADNALVPTSTPDPRSHVRHPYYTPYPAMSTAMVMPQQTVIRAQRDALLAQMQAVQQNVLTPPDPLSGHYHMHVAQPGGEILHPGGATATETPFIPQMTPRNPKERHPPRHFQTPDGGTWKIKGKEVPMPKEGDSVWAYIQSLRAFALEVDPTGSATGPKPARSSHPCGWGGWEMLDRYGQHLEYEVIDFIDVKIFWDDRREWGPYPTMGVAPKTKSWGQVPDIPLPDEWKGFSLQEVTV